MPADINSVSVTFENGVKREEYGPTKKASVTINASVGENEDGAVVLAFIGSLAIAKVADLLYAPKPDTAAQPATASAGEQAPPARRGRPPKSPDRLIERATSASAPEAPAETGGGAADQAATAPAGEADEDWSAGAQVITDAELLASTIACAQRLGDREPVKNLITTFDPQKGQGEGAFKVQDIPAELRPDYLSKLAAL